MSNHFLTWNQQVLSSPLRPAETEGFLWWLPAQVASGAGGFRRRWLPQTGSGGFLTEIVKSTLGHKTLARKVLLSGGIFASLAAGGFRVDSPVRNPVASEMAR